MLHMHDGSVDMLLTQGHGSTEQKLSAQLDDRDTLLLFSRRFDSASFVFDQNGTPEYQHGYHVSVSRDIHLFRKCVDDQPAG